MKTELCGNIFFTQLTEILETNGVSD
jgi:hypothetical protein